MGFKLAFLGRTAVNLAVHYMNKKPKSEPGGPSRGSIICTASNAGLYPLPVAPLYAASKFGVVGLVRSTARIIAQANMQINALAPAVLGMCPFSFLVTAVTVLELFQESDPRKKRLTPAALPPRYQHRP